MPKSKDRMLNMLFLSPEHIAALDAVYGRAKDDWATYRHSGHGPADLGGQEKWDEYVKTVDTEMVKARTAIKRIVQAWRYAA
jgi:hypothetical protein